MRELWQGALSGGRLNVHPLYPRPDLKIGEREFLLLRSGLMAGMTRLRLLDFITHAPLDCPVAVIFGHACAMNWAGPSYNRVGLEVASALCAEGFPADLLPSSLADGPALRLDEEGYVCLGPQRYRAAVLYQPEFCGARELAFFSRAAQGQTAIFQVGQWTRDGDARPLQTAERLGDKLHRCADDDSCSAAVKCCLEQSGIPRVTGWNRTKATHPLPPVDGFTALTDGTDIRVAGRLNAAGDPIHETFTWQGHTVEVDGLGVVAIRFASDGHVNAFAAGGLKRVKTDGLAIERADRADVAFLRKPDGTYSGALQGGAGAVPGPLRTLTAQWQRLDVPRQRLTN